jgi:hypothetical protein
MAHANLARYHVYRGEPDAGLPSLLESVDLVVPLRHKGGTAYLLDVFAEAAALLGASERGVHLFAAADKVLEGIGSPSVPSLRERNARNLQRLEERLGTQTFRNAWSQGAAMSFDEAVAEAGELTRWLSLHDAGEHEAADFAPPA